jgi:hypothetical protein
MELTDERLAEVLVARKVPVSRETLTILRAGLGMLRSRYEMETARNSPTKIREDLVELCESLSIVVDKFECDAGLYVAMKLDDSSPDAWDLRRYLLEQQRALLAAAERASKLFIGKSSPGAGGNRRPGSLFKPTTYWPSLLESGQGSPGPRISSRCSVPNCSAWVASSFPSTRIPIKIV